MDNKAGGSITEKIKDRLAGFLGGREDAAAFSNGSKGYEDSPLNGLKATILSMDWEISDEIFEALIEETNRLEKKYENDKEILLFLQLLRSAGKYIKKRKAEAHPGAVSFLNSVYVSLEQVVLSDDISLEEKRQKLLDRVEEFKKLKEQVALQKRDAAISDGAIPSGETKHVLVEEEDEPVGIGTGPPEKIKSDLSKDIGGMIPPEALDHILTEIRRIIKSEFVALKEELKKQDGP